MVAGRLKLAGRCGLQERSQKPPTGESERARDKMGEEWKKEANPSRTHPRPSRLTDVVDEDDTDGSNEETVMRIGRGGGSSSCEPWRRK